jgi:hypothetical protein
MNLLTIAEKWVSADLWARVKKYFFLLYGPIPFRR